MTVKDLEKGIKNLIKEYGKEAYNFKVVIGDDEELNGLHDAYFAEWLSGNDEYISLIDYGKTLDENNFLIS